VVRTLLLRGMGVGLLAGIFAFVVARVLGDGPLAAGIAYDRAATAPAPAPGAPELVSRTVQSTLGLATGTLVLGVALGGLYALAYAVAQGRLGSLSARATALTVAVGGFVGVHVLPALKYPPNPPGVSNADTVVERSQWYLVMLVISLGVVVGAAVLARALAPRWGSWNAAVVAGLGGLVVVGVAYAVLPVIDETPADFRADVLWQFRLASSGVQLSIWSTLGLVFGALTERSLRAHRPVTARA